MEGGKEEFENRQSSGRTKVHARARSQVRSGRKAGSTEGWAQRSAFLQPHRSTVHTATTNKTRRRKREERHKAGWRH